MTILGQDSFSSRTVSGSWGTASDGQTWSEQGGIRTILGVGGGEGTIHGGNSNAIILLGSGIATDQDSIVRLALGQIGDVMGLILRSNADGTTYYECEIGNYTNDIEIAKVVAGSFSSLNVWAAGFTINYGSFYFMRFRVVADTLSCKIWPDDGSAEPSDWTGTVTDSVIASGHYGVYANSFDVIDMQFDHYIVTDTHTSTTIAHDLTSRFLLAIQSLRTLSARLQTLAITQRGLPGRTRLQASALWSLGLRLRFSSQAQVSSLSARFASLATTSKNISARIKAQASISRDTASRERLQAENSRSLGGRARFSSVALFQSIALRFASLAIASKNISARIKAQAGAFRDITGRQWLQAGTTRFLSSRFRLASTAVFRLVALRVALLSSQKWDLPLLLRSQASTLRYLGTRTRVQVTLLPSLSARFLLTLRPIVQIRMRLAVQRIRDTAVRTLVQARVVRGVGSRLLTLGIASRDIVGLLILSAQHLVGVTARLSLLARGLLFLPTRLSLLAQQSQSFALRVRSQVTLFLSTSVRMRSAPGVTSHLSLRAHLLNLGIQQKTDLVSRFLLKKSPVVYHVGSWSSQPDAFFAGPLISVPLPTQSYTWNGVPLDMPSVRTAPMDRGRMIAEGSTFLLLFNTPSIETQAQLVDDSIGELSFAVSAATLVQGQVHLSVTRTDGIWQVLCTTLSPILVKTGV